MKVVARDQIYNFIVEKIFIWDRYSCEIGYTRHLKVMIKEKYFISGHMWWCSPVVENGTREAEVVGSNPGNARKNHTRAKNHATCDFFWFFSRCKYLFYSRWDKENNFLIFIHTVNIYFNPQKHDVHHLCVDIGDGLKPP